MIFLTRTPEPFLFLFLPPFFLPLAKMIKIIPVHAHRWDIPILEWNNAVVPQLSSYCRYIYSTYSMVVTVPGVKCHSGGYRQVASEVKLEYRTLVPRSKWSGEIKTTVQ